MLQALIGPVANLVGGFLNNKHEQAQAKHQAKLQVIQNDADWESKMAAANLPVAGRTSSGLLFSQSLSFALVTVLWLMIPLFLSVFLTVFLLWILCQIGISIYYFLQYLRHLESVVLIS